MREEPARGYPGPFWHLALLDMMGRPIPCFDQPQEVRVKHVHFAAAAFLLLFAAPAIAQDPTVVDADHYKVAFENDHVRVLRITYGPGEMSVMHEHPDAVAVMLGASQMNMHFPDGTTEELEWSAGDAWWTPAVIHRPENLTGDPVEVILVEMKSPQEEGCM